MRVVWALLAENMVERPDGGLDIHGAGPSAVVEAIPGIVGLRVAVCIAGQSSEFDQPSRMVFEVFGPTGEEPVFRKAGPLTTGRVSSLVESGIESTARLPGYLEFDVVEPGRYRVVISLNGDQAADLPIDVVPARTNWRDGDGALRLAPVLTHPDLRRRAIQASSSASQSRRSAGR